MIGDLALWNDLVSQGYRYKVLDVQALTAPCATRDGFCAANLHYGPHVQGAGGAPALLVLDTSSTPARVVRAVKLPATSAGVRSLLQEIVK